MKLSVEKYTGCLLGGAIGDAFNHLSFGETDAVASFSSHVRFFVWPARIDF